MKNKKMLAACLGAAVLVAGFGGVYLYARPQTQAGEKSVQVRVVPCRHQAEYPEKTSA